MSPDLTAESTHNVVTRAPRRAKSPARRNPRPRINRAGLGVLLVTLLLCAFCAYKGKTTLVHGTRPIERMRTGDTLPYNVNPSGEEDREFGETIVPDRWRNLFLKAPKEDGSWAEVELMLPVAHLEKHGAQVGDTLPISVPECGIHGDATVLKIEPSPDLPDDPNLRIVTGVFKHHNAKVVDVTLSDGTITGSTPNHRWWSDDRLAFVRADELRAGENLQTIDGASLTVASVTPRPGRHTVYNLQVHFSHVYHVGAGGALVHNSGVCGLNRGNNPSRVLFEEFEVRAVRNLAHVDESTLRAMSKHGFAAKDINGKKLFLHHHQQNPAGPLIEIPGFRHSIGNRIQHPLGNAAGVGLTPEQKEAFDAFRTRYWKARAFEELILRGLTP